MATYTFETDHVFDVGGDFYTDNGHPGITIDLGALKHNVVAAFVQRGMTHHYTNVPQSAAYAAAKKAVAKAEGFDEVSKWEKSLGNSAVVKAAIKAWRQANPDANKAMALAAIDAAHAKVMNGELMPERVASDGTPRDPVEAEMRKLAIDKVREILAGKGLAPKRDFSKVVDEALTLPDGNGGVFTPTMNELIARRLASDEANLRKTAEQLITARQRAVSKLSGEDLGL